MSIILARVQFYHLAVDQILAQSLFGIFENSKNSEKQIYEKITNCKLNIKVS